MHVDVRIGASARRRLAAVAGGAVLAAAGLAGCGAEAVGAAATAGGLQAKQLEQARKQQAAIVEGFKQAEQAGVARAASAAD